MTTTTVRHGRRRRDVDCHNFVMLLLRMVLFITGSSSFLASSIVDAAFLPPTRSIRLCNHPNQQPLLSSSNHDAADPDDADDYHYEDDQDTIDSVSDAEALLACHSYLQRRNRLDGWQDAKDRRKRRRASLRSMVEDEDAADIDPTNNTISAEEDDRENEEEGNGSDDSDHYSRRERGFFWSDPNELKYFSATSLRHLNDDIEQGIQQQLEFAGLTEASASRYDVSALLSDGDDSYDITEPSMERVRRSNAARRKWSDTAFKEQWYENRWGGRRRHRKQQQRQQQRIVNDERRRAVLEEKLRAINPEEFMSHPALAAMTQDEIAHAIRTYIRRTGTLNNNHDGGDDDFEENDAGTMKTSTTAAPDTIHEQYSHQDAVVVDDRNAVSSSSTFFRSDPVRMEEDRRRRSERAKAAYQTRIKNQSTAVKNENNNNTSSKRKKKDPTSYSEYSGTTVEPATTTSNPYKIALERIEDALDVDQLPRIQDVECVLKPGKLAKRKDLLRRILNERFGLRGKCIPVISSSDDTDDGKQQKQQFTFVTQCSIPELGQFVIHKMKERISINHRG